MSQLTKKNRKKTKKREDCVRTPLGNHEEVQAIAPSGNMTSGIEIGGIAAMRWARELSKLPDGDFTLCYFPYSRQRNKASATLVVKEHCKWRSQPDASKMYDSTIDQDNLLHFTDGDGQPRTCWRILIRYMAFSQDGYKLHKINWLGD